MFGGNVIPGGGRIDGFPAVKPPSSACPEVLSRSNYSMPQKAGRVHSALIKPCT